MAVRPLVLAGTTGVLAVGAAVVLLAGTGDGPVQADGVVGEPALGMAHVHGLGVDPADGALLAGTHFGTFRIGEDGAAEQVGPQQDFMGFTVVGPRHYLASGHPGAMQDAPPNLGLIESTDGGRTWESVSLRGEADFHTLESRDGVVYGHSGGVLLASEDGEEWEERAAIPLADLAVSPTDTDLLLATTERGLARSTDGGRSFAPVAGSPVLVLLSWTEEGRLVGIDPSGGVHVSEDAAVTWSRVGSAGAPPAALTAAGDEVFVATHDGDIVESEDGGRTFRPRYTAE